MRSQPIDEALLVKYLLGNLTEKEQAGLEDRAFADPDFLVALEAAEADLIDAYVRGEFSKTERRSFEQRFLLSPERRRKVAFARDLARVTAETKAAQPAFSTRLSSRQFLVGLVRGWTPALQFAAGLAALICVAGASLLIVQNMTMRSALATLQTR